MSLRIAVCSVTIGAESGMAACILRLRALLRIPLMRGADVIVLPESLALELVAGFSKPARRDPSAAFATLQRLRPAWLAVCASIAAEHRVVLVAGSFPVRMASGRYRNRCDVFLRDGSHVFQDKLRLTLREKATGVIEAGDALNVFDVDGVAMAVALG